jgi:hypothetical protein
LAAWTYAIDVRGRLSFPFTVFEAQHGAETADGDTLIKLIRKRPRALISLRMGEQRSKYYCNCQDDQTSELHLFLLHSETLVLVDGRNARLFRAMPEKCVGNTF